MKRTAQSSIAVAFVAVATFGGLQWANTPPPVRAEPPVVKQSLTTAPTPVAVASAVIEAPATIDPGDLLILDAGKSDAASFSWLVFPPKTILPIEGGRKCVAAFGQPGEYRFVLATAKGDVVATAQHVVIVGKPLPPVPTPPVPVPPGPGPTPPPVVEGKRAVLIIRETADATPEQSRLVVALRTGVHAEYLKSKGHTLSILDDDSVDKDGNPTPAVTAWREQFAGMTLPVVFIIDAATKTLVHKQSIPQTAKADEIMALVKAHGG